MHNASPVTPLTIGKTELKESDDLVILGVTFDSNMTFEKNLFLVSRAVLKYLVSFLQCGSRLPIHTLNYWTGQSVVPSS